MLFFPIFWLNSCLQKQGHTVHGSEAIEKATLAVTSVIVIVIVIIIKLYCQTVIDWLSEWMIENASTINKFSIRISIISDWMTEGQASSWRTSDPSINMHATWVWSTWYYLGLICPKITNEEEAFHKYWEHNNRYPFVHNGNGSKWSIMVLLC